MAQTFTRNLKLIIDSNLTASAKYNLNKIDSLGSTFLVDSTNTLQIRSLTDVTLEPNSADLGGSGTGGTVNIGTSNHQVDLNLFVSAFSLSSPLGLLDQAVGGSKQLEIQYKSDLHGSVDTSANRNLFVDVDGADRSLVLGGGLSLLGGDLTLNLSGPTSLSLPLSGTLSTLSGNETLTNKSIDASVNSITNLSNSAISNSAAISYSKLNLAGSILDSDVSPSAGISYTKLNLSNQIVNSDISNSAAIARSKIAAGPMNQVVINSAGGTLSSVAQLATTMGGTGQNSTATFPTSGLVLTNSNTATLSNKSIDGGTNSLTGITYGSLSISGSLLNSDINPSAGIVYSKLNLSSSIVNSDIALSAAIAYTKLNLTGSILNADISNSASIAYSKLNLANSISNSDVSGAAAIAGTKIAPDFGNQEIRTEQKLTFSTGGWDTVLGPATSGQTGNLVFNLPNTEGLNGQVLTTNGSGDLSWITVTGTGTVTSVALTAPAEFTVTGSPITSAGTIAISKANQSANLVYAGPASGGPAQPTFRALTAADISSIVGYRNLDATWAPGDGATKTVTHSWGSQKIIVQVLDTGNNYANVSVDITRPDGNTVVLTSTSAPASNWLVLLSEVA